MRRLLIPVTLLSALLTTTVIWACSVPVFRYALERWPADQYSAVVFHRGPLQPEQQRVVDLFAREGAVARQSANVELKLVDLDADPAPQDLELWKRQESETLPLLVMRTPLPAPVPVGFWSGELTEENVTRLIDSPLRQKIAKQLINGQTAVWVFLESGDAEQDKAALEQLKAELKRMEKTLKLPEIEQADIEQGLVSVAPESLKLKFSVETLSRKEAAEDYFTRMLIATENDLHEFSDEPMALPVFGRGRVLYALIGKGINPGTIEQACRDLTGPCTCQVKDQNPGTDLLMAVNWEKLVTPTPQEEKEIPDLTGLTSFSKQGADAAQGQSMSKEKEQKSDQATPKTESVSAEQTAQAEPATAETKVQTQESDSADAGTTELPAAGTTEAAQSSSLLRNLSILAVLAIVIVLAASYIVMGRKSES